MTAAPEGERLGRLSPTGRVEAFSDGVMAIAITLLVLDLKVPSPADAADGRLLQAHAFTSQGARNSQASGGGDR
jgi:uncharacterized membrane protein